MKFLTDENIYVPMVGAIRKQGHGVLDIKEEKLFGMEDYDIIEMAGKEDRILITADKGFSNILIYPPARYKGIIVLRLSKLTIKTATKRLIQFLSTLKPEQIEGKLVIVEPDRARFHG